MAENGNDQEHDVVWGAKNIGAVINKTEKATFHLLEKKKLPGKKVGEQWVSSRSALKRLITPDAPEAA